MGDTTLALGCVHWERTSKPLHTTRGGDTRHEGSQYPALVLESGLAGEAPGVEDADFWAPHLPHSNGLPDVTSVRGAFNTQHSLDRRWYVCSLTLFISFADIS